MKSVVENVEVTENFFEVVQRRRAIRKYKHEEIPESDLRKIIDAARLAPSAENSQPWRFIVVRDQKSKELLARPSPQKFISEADTIIAVLGDPSVSCCPAAQTWTTRDPMIAADHLVLAATALGYSSCWIANFKSRPKEWIDEVKQTLKIPGNIHIIVLIALGVADEDPAPRPRKSIQEIAFREEFGRLFAFQ